MGLFSPRCRLALVISQGDFSIFLSILVFHLVLGIGPDADFGPVERELIISKI